MQRIPTRDINSIKKLSCLTTFLFDCDGVIWNGNTLVDGAKELIQELKDKGKKVFFITNNSAKTREEYAKKCQSLDLNISYEEVIGSAYVAASYLKTINFTGKLYCAGPKSLGVELDNVGIKHTGIGPDSFPEDFDSYHSFDGTKLDPTVTGVIVGFDHHINYLKIQKAASYASNGLPFFATNEDSRVPAPNSELMSPGTGCIVAAVKVAAGKEPIVMGKPHKPTFDVLCKMHHIDPSNTLMIGDRLETDILFGNNFGMLSAVVLTGITTLPLLEEVTNNGDPGLVPHYVMDSVKDMLPHV